MIEENPTPQINYLECEHYLETLIGEGWEDATLVFQSFDDNADRRRQAAKTARALGRTYKDPYAKVMQGTWAKTKDLLTTLNNNGAGIFLTVNRTVGGRRIEHLQEIRAIWCEWDHTEPLPEWPLAPHLVIESSPAKFHCYWLISKCSPPDHHRLMATMVGLWKSDPDALDVVRVLRVPGFIHRKVDATKGLTGTPWGVKIVSAESRDALPLYTTEALIEAFRVGEWEARLQAAPTHENAPTRGRTSALPLNLVEVREALKFVFPEERAVWLRIGMALASTHHPQAFALWDEWSKASSKYEEEDQYKNWQSFREQKYPDHDGPRITMGSLFKTAKDAGWDRSAGWQQGLLLSQQGNPLACPSNIALILRHTPLWKDALRFNLFSGQIEYGIPTFDAFGRGLPPPNWSDVDDLTLADYLRATHRMAVTQLSHCAQAVLAVAHDARYDPITTWLESLPAWDGIERLPSFFVDHCNASPSVYTSFCGISWFVSLIARAYQPGCQLDTVVVMQGPEGAKKTSTLRLIGGPWYKAISPSFESKDLLLALQSAWLGELAELDPFSRSGQARIAAILTTIQDDYRPSYGRHEVHQLRRTVFCGTTNESSFIATQHGGRRFLPIAVATINVEGIAASLPQLFAEALVRYRRHEPWWITNETLQTEATLRREDVREFDLWEISITRFCEENPGEVSLDDIFGPRCLDVPIERRNRGLVARVSPILKRLGYEKMRRRSPDDWQTKEYVYVKNVKKP